MDYEADCWALHWKQEQNCMTMAMAMALFVDHNHLEKSSIPNQSRKQWKSILLSTFCSKSGSNKRQIETFADIFMHIACILVSQFMADLIRPSLWVLESAPMKFRVHP
jgi:hypothetical protein